jgi:hypothetical protein
MAAKSSGGGFGNAVRDLVRSVTGGGGAETRRAEDKAARAPSYSGMSIKGLTSSDPANVARNQAAVARINAAEAAAPSTGGRDRPAAAAAAAPAAPPAAPVTPPMAPVTPTPPAAPAPVVPGEAPTSAAEAAAIASAGGGRASTIVTGALGLLADAEATGQLRKRRSLMSGGMIQ